MDRRARRVVLNEAAFREANEALTSLSGTIGEQKRVGLVCECGRDDCIDEITMTPEAYEQLRSDPTLFAVVPGHETPEVEDVVEEREGYDVVQKHPEAHAIAEATDPRTD
jgi:hypothetical protein